jgi:hypothetical protein
VRWENGSVLKLHFRGEQVAFLHLRSEGRGLYEALVKEMLAVFRGFGVKTFTAVPSDAGARKALAKQGKWTPTAAGGLRWEI